MVNARGILSLANLMRFHSTQYLDVNYFVHSLSVFFLVVEKKIKIVGNNRSLRTYSKAIE